MDLILLNNIQNSINQISVKSTYDYKGIKKLLIKKKQLKENNLFNEYLKDENNKLSKFGLIYFDDELFECVDNMRHCFNNIKVAWTFDKKEEHILNVRKRLNNNEMLERLFASKHAVFNEYKELLNYSIEINLKILKLDK
jgi:hypothetical protein